MRYLGIDFGTKRVGLALGLADTNMAFPLKTIFRTTRQEMFDEILDLIDRENIDAIVLGMPWGPSAEPGLTGRQALNFKQSLQRRTDRPVFIVNEDFSSCEAKSILSSRGLSSDRQKKCLDQVAAVLILESFLNQRA